MTMFIFRLLLAVFSFLEKLSSFALALKVRIILHCSHLCVHFKLLNERVIVMWEKCHSVAGLKLSNVAYSHGSL